MAIGGKAVHAVALGHQHRAGVGHAHDLIHVGADHAHIAQFPARAVLRVRHKGHHRVVHALVHRRQIPAVDQRAPACVLAPGVVVHLQVRRARADHLRGLEHHLIHQLLRVGDGADHHPPGPVVGNGRGRHGAAGVQRHHPKKLIAGEKAVVQHRLVGKGQAVHLAAAVLQKHDGAVMFRREQHRRVERAGPGRKDALLHLPGVDGVGILAVDDHQPLVRPHSHAAVAGREGGVRPHRIAPLLRALGGHAGKRAAVVIDKAIAGHLHALIAGERHRRGRAVARRAERLTDQIRPQHRKRADRRGDERRQPPGETARSPRFHWFTPKISIAEGLPGRRAPPAFHKSP